MAITDKKRVLAHRMAMVARNWRGLADGELAQFGVSNSAGWCLIHIERLGPAVRQTDLAEALDISQPSLVRTLDQLQVADLIARVTHPDDKRANLIGLTPAGQELVGRIEAKLDALRGQLLDGVPDDALEIALWVIDMLSLRISEYKAQP
jgi:MarR family transcriptional regulator for hemolysin